MGCGASAPAVPPSLVGGGASLECRSTGADQLPLLQGVLVISPGHRISAARNTAPSSSAQPQQRRPEPAAAAAMSA